VTAGNPFLLAELTRALDAAELDLSEEGIRCLGEAAAQGVSSSIRARLGRLGGSSIAMARAVAVLEPNAEPPLVATLAELPLAEVTEVGERLIAAGLLTDSRSSAFVHPLIRDAVLSDLPEPRRAALHAHAARLLGEANFEADSIAAHLLLTAPAGDEWVVAALRDAARAALSRGAAEAAVRYLRRAMREPPTAAERLAVSRELGVALLRASDPEGIEVLRTVRTATDEPELRGQIANELASSLGLRNGNEEAAGLIEGSLSELPDPEGELGTMLRGWLLIQVVWGLERVPEIAIPAENPSPETMPGRVVLQGLALLGALGLGVVEEARRLAEEAVVRTETLFEDALAGLPPQGALIALALADRGGEVAGMLDLGIEGARRRGVLPGIGGGHGARSCVHFLDGDLREAQADGEIAIDVVKRFELVAPKALWSSIVLRVLMARGERHVAERLLDELWSGRERVAGGPGAALLCARAELRAAAGRHAEARNDFLSAAERIRWLPFANPEVYPWRIGLAGCEAALGNGEEARRLADEAVALARRAGGRRGIGVTLCAHGRLAGGDEGVELLREAVGVLGGTRARLHHARALVELGAALRRTKRRRDAREPLREGMELAHRCGAVPLEEQARTELAATGARPRKAVFTGVESLTPSELRVARLAAEGMTNREIAQALTVTAKTVETHMRHVFQKLDIERRTELAGVLSAGQPGAAGRP
jgi:DNA-binding CsgD family transcriptional regulator